MAIQQPSQAWKDDCETWRGRLLTGDFAHWCDDWDGLPIDETTSEWPCACADAMMLWKLALGQWPLTPQTDLDSVWSAWYASGMLLHIRFICKTCHRQISGCGKNCEGQHKTEEVESCAVCAQKDTKDE